MKGPFRLDQRHALVTGGASGIGAETVRTLHHAGAHVTIADLNPNAAQALAAELGEGVDALRLDVTDQDSIAEAFASLSALDYLINNAGVGHVGSIEECDYDSWRTVMSVNVDGPYLVTQAALPLLKASSHGAIVNQAGDRADVDDRPMRRRLQQGQSGLVGIKRRFAYCASKGAVVAMSRQLAAEYAGQVRVNCICPGTVDTPFVEAYLEKYHKHEKDEMRVQLNARQPIGRLGKPEEIAHMALYLCSDEAEFVHGATLEIDGGWTAL